MERHQRIFLFSSVNLSYHFYFLVLLIGITFLSGCVPVNLRISATIDDANDIEADYAISPNYQRVVYRTCTYKCELHSAPSMGGPVEVLIDDYYNNLDLIYEFAISPDSQYVVFRAINSWDTRTRVYSVPILGGAYDELSENVYGDAGVASFQISPDSQRVIYTADKITDQLYELYSVPVSGGTSIKLNANMPAECDSDCSIRGYEIVISPDSQRVIYGFLNESIPAYELYSVAITGGTPVKLNNTSITMSWTPSFKVTPDSSTVVYISDQNIFQKYELIKVPILGGTRTILSGTLPDLGEVKDFKITTNAMGAFVVFRADKDVVGKFELYSVPISGVAIFKLNAEFISAADIEEYAISPNGAWVVYLADQEIDGKNELYSASILGGAVKLNSPLVAGGQIIKWQISPDSEHVVYRADQDIDGKFELYSVPIEGGTVDKLNFENMGDDQDVYDFEISPNGEGVAYIGDVLADGPKEAFGSATANFSLARLSGDLVSGGNVETLEISPDNRFLVYYADQVVNDKFELFVSYEKGAYNFYLPVVYH